MAAKKERKIDFEKSLAELEELVEEMESGDLSLEDSLKAFEKGMKLSKDCQEALAAAEQKVRMLVEDREDPEFVDYPADDSE